MNSKTRPSAKPTKSTESNNSKRARKSVKLPKAPKPASLRETAGDKQGQSDRHVVRRHDLKSVAVVSIPDEVKNIIGEEACARAIENLGHYKMVFIMRTASDVVYIRIPVFAVASQPPLLPPEELVQTAVSEKVKIKPKTKTIAKAKPKVNKKTSAKVNRNSVERSNRPAL